MYTEKALLGFQEEAKVGIRILSSKSKKTLLMPDFVHRAKSRVEDLIRFTGGEDETPGYVTEELERIHELLPESDGVTDGENDISFSVVENKLPENMEKEERFYTLLVAVAQELAMSIRECETEKSMPFDDARENSVEDIFNILRKLESRARTDRMLWDQHEVPRNHVVAQAIRQNLSEGSVKPD